MRLGAREAISKRWRAARHRRLLGRRAGPRLLAGFAQSHPAPFFVEVGANDGEKHDHLRPLVLAGGWHGIVVEPVPYVFARLRRNYAGLPGVICENVAITDRDGELPFYHLAEPAPNELEHLPEWYDGIGSFSEEAVLGHRPHVPDIERRVVRRRVTTLTYRSLLSRHGVEQVDLLVVDTEGHDWEILKTVDLGERRPRLIVYEHFHLPLETRNVAHAHLVAAGYATMEEGFDTFALDTTLEDDLTRLWRRLRPALPGVYVTDEPR